jgi:hypothetical protein
VEGEEGKGREGKMEGNGNGKDGWGWGAEDTTATHHKRRERGREESWENPLLFPFFFFLLLLPHFFFTALCSSLYSVLHYAFIVIMCVCPVLKHFYYYYLILRRDGGKMGWEISGNGREMDGNRDGGIGGLDGKESTEGVIREILLFCSLSFFAPYSLVVFVAGCSPLLLESLDTDGVVRGKSRWFWLLGIFFLLEKGRGWGGDAVGGVVRVAGCSRF